MSDNSLDELISVFSKLPGLGKRSARRIVLHLIQNKEKLMQPLAFSVKDAIENIKNCRICGNYDSSDPCSICTSERKDKNVICVVESALDLWAFERSNIFAGFYHVLGGTLSAVEGIRPSDLNVESLINRIDETITEIIIATNATMAGQTTAFYLTDRIKEKGNIKVTRLAHGIPIGGELDYLDEGTIEAALTSRKLLSAN